MSYKPNYAMYSKAEEGFHDEPFEYVYSFEKEFGAPISTAAQANLKDQPLEIDPDADFYLRSIAQLIDQAPTGEGRIDFNMRLRDSFGRPLDNGFIPMAAYALTPFPVGPFPAPAGAPSASPVLPELFCPRNTVLLADFETQAAAAASSAIAITGPFTVAARSALDTAPYYNRPVVFAHGATNRYLFAVDTGVNPRVIRAYKSLDSGATWAEQDAAGVPSVNNLTGTSSPIACPTYLLDPTNADVVWACYCENTGQHTSLVSFDMSTDTWGVPDIGGPVCSGIDTGGADQSQDDTGAKTCLQYRASDNTFVIQYQGPADFTSGQNFSRPYYVTFARTGSVWSAGQKLIGGAAEAKHYVVDGIAIDANELTHCIICSPTNATGSTPFEIYHVAVDSTDTVNVGDLVTNQVQAQREPNVGYVQIRTPNAGGTEELIISFRSVVSGSLFGAAVVRAPVAVTPVWTVEPVSTSPADSPIFDNFETPSIAIGPDNNPYVFWAGAPSGAGVDPGYKAWYSAGGDQGAGWSTPVNFFSSADPLNDTLELPTVAALPGIGFGLVFFELGTVSTDVVAYWEFALSAIALGQFYSFHLYFQGVKRFHNEECAPARSR